MTGEETKSQGIQSIEVGIDILKKIAEAGKPVTITEIAVICETSKSKLHRYLTSFVRTGILEKTQDGKYILGTELVLLGFKASQKLNIIDISSPHLLDLKDILNETVALAIWGQEGPFFVSWEEANGPVNIGIKVGSQVSVTQSAAGLIFAAFLPEHVTARKIDEELTADMAELDDFKEQVNFVQQNNYSFVKGSTIPGISAIAAPIFERTSNLVAVLTVVGLEHSLDTSINSVAVLQLKEKANLISRLLGWDQ
ncbi:IclR family transcriptional regulator [Bacillus sp. B15-48]|uniref:IclR family transcriptional regulator n=1 Tax=Bacillus sp. B15-48 TaxID=1548601 RepID=UPI00193F796B|nr:IclR family transcriptional regulator [Bacillus sp. B15-48]MBM4761161.1 helix-turn-helix domain-containing protein [Bacillus sp. B15-48]